MTSACAAAGWLLLAAGARALVVEPFFKEVRRNPLNGRLYTWEEFYKTHINRKVNEEVSKKSDLDNFWFKQMTIVGDSQETKSTPEPSRAYSHAAASTTTQPVMEMTAQQAPYSVKDRVEGLFDGRWYPATVRSIHSDGTYTIDWDDGTYSDYGSDLLRSRNQALRQSASRADVPWRQAADLRRRHSNVSKDEDVKVINAAARSLLSDAGNEHHQKRAAPNTGGVAVEPSAETRVLAQAAARELQLRKSRSQALWGERLFDAAGPAALYELQLFPHSEVIGEEIGAPGPIHAWGMVEQFREPGEVQDFIAKYCYPNNSKGRRLYNVSVPTLTPYIVDRSDPRRTDIGVIVAPGGGCQFLAYDIEGTDIAKWLNSYGISAFVLKYRVPCTGENHLELQRSLLLLRYHATDFGLNPSRIGVMGFGHGGEMAMFAGINAKRGYDPYDEIDNSNFSVVPDFNLLVYPGMTPQALRSPVKEPPTFIATASDDQCQPSENSLRYYLKMLRKKVEGAEVHVYPHGKHGHGRCSLYPADNASAGDDVCDWTDDAITFLERRFFSSYQAVAREQPAEAFDEKLESLRVTDQTMLEAVAAMRKEAGTMAHALEDISKSAKTYHARGEKYAQAADLAIHKVEAAKESQQLLNHPPG